MSEIKSLVAYEDTSTIEGVHQYHDEYGGDFRIEVDGKFLHHEFILSLYEYVRGAYVHKISATKTGNRPTKNVGSIRAAHRFLIELAQDRGCA